MPLQIKNQGAPLLVNAGRCRSLEPLQDQTGILYSVITLEVTPDFHKSVVLAMTPEEAASVLNISNDKQGGVVVFNSSIDGKNTLIPTSSIAMAREIGGGMTLLHYERENGKPETYYAELCFREVCETIISTDRYGGSMIDSGFPERNAFGLPDVLNLFRQNIVKSGSLSV